jgi:hypothetical protein
MAYDRLRAPQMAAVLAAVVCAFPTNARADWMVGGFLGQAWTRPSTVVLTLPSQETRLEIAGVEYRGESFRSPQYYGVRVVWIPNAHRWIGIEGEWIHAKAFAQTSRIVHVRGTLRGAPIDASLPLSSLVQRLAMSHGLNFILANVAVRHDVGPVNSQRVARLVAVVRAGAGPMTPHAESRIDNVARGQYEYSGVGAQLGGGVELSLWRGLGMLGEYKFTWAAPRIDVAGGEAKVPTRSHHVVFGLAYRL